MESLTCIDARHDLPVSAGIEELADGVIRHPTSRAWTEKGHGRAIFVNGSNKIVLGNNAAVGSQCLVDLLLFQRCQKRSRPAMLVTTYHEWRATRVSALLETGIVRLDTNALLWEGVVSLNNIGGVSLRRKGLVARSGSISRIVLRLKGRVTGERIPGPVLNHGWMG